jgi:hypothetical protein
VRFLLACIIIILLSECFSQPDCLVTATNSVRISLKRTDSDSVNTVAFSMIKVSGTDTIFYKNTKASTLTLPVNPAQLQTTFTFQYRSKPDTTIVKLDSVKLSYTTQKIIISPECGGYLYYSNLSVLSTSFVNQPKVVNSQLSTSATNNLEIKL